VTIASLRRFTYNLEEKLCVVGVEEQTGDVTVVTESLDCFSSSMTQHPHNAIGSDVKSGTGTPPGPCPKMQDSQTALTSIPSLVISNFSPAKSRDF
jgi:hypothetical protein